MKICVSSTGMELTSPIDPRFGRAAHLVVVDTEARDLTPLNGATGAVHGAGIQAAGAVVESGAKALVTGQIGPNAYDVLEAAGIAVHLTAGGTVAEAIEEFNAGRLEKLSAPNSRRHSGMRR